MARWVRFVAPEGEGFGSIEGESIVVHDGDLFNRPRATGRRLDLGAVRLAMPMRPS